MATEPATLFDAPAAEAARDQAIKAVDEHAPEAVKNRILETIRYVASVRAEFTTDHVWEAMAGVDLGDWTVREPRLMGALMKKAHRAGWIKPSDRFEASKRTAAHAGPKRVWKSVIF